MNFLSMLSAVSGHASSVSLVVAFLLGVAAGPIIRQSLRAIVIGLFCFGLFGCAGQASTPSFSAGQTLRTSGEFMGVPVSGAVRVGANSGSLYIQPNISIRQLRFGQ